MKTKLNLLPIIVLIMLTAACEKKEGVSPSSTKTTNPTKTPDSTNTTIKIDSASHIAAGPTPPYTDTFYGQVYEADGLPLSFVANIHVYVYHSLRQELTLTSDVYYSADEEGSTEIMENVPVDSTNYYSWVFPNDHFTYYNFRITNDSLIYNRSHNMCADDYITYFAGYKTSKY